MLVIINFDSCTVKGNSLPDKQGELPKGICTTEFENNDFALKKLRKELDLKGMNKGLLEKWIGTPWMASIYQLGILAT